MIAFAAMSLFADLIVVAVVGFAIVVVVAFDSYFLAGVVCYRLWSIGIRAVGFGMGFGRGMIEWGCRDWLWVMMRINCWR